jgi:hypothetical protein
MYIKSMKRSFFSVLVLFFIAFSLIFPSSPTFSDVGCCSYERSCFVDYSNTRDFECCNSSTDWCTYARYVYDVDYNYSVVPSCPPLITDCFPSSFCIYQNSAGYPVTRRAYYYTQLICWDGPDPDQYAICGRMHL